MEHINQPIDTFFKTALEGFQLQPSMELRQALAHYIATKKKYDWQNLSLISVCVIAFVVCILDFNYIVGDTTSSAALDVPVSTTLFIAAAPEPIIYKAPELIVENIKVPNRTKKNFHRKKARNKSVYSH